jgi:hypothetical protein
MLAMMVFQGPSRRRTWMKKQISLSSCQFGNGLSLTSVQHDLRGQFLSLCRRAGIFEGTGILDSPAASGRRRRRRRLFLDYKVWSLGRHVVGRLGLLILILALFHVVEAGVDRAGGVEESETKNDRFCHFCCCTAKG